MSRKHEYFVYIMTNRFGTLYVGLAGNLRKRVHEHKSKMIPGFTSRYNIDRLVYFETFGDIHSAITREKSIKGWVRSKKVALINTANPNWLDLSEEWYE